LLWVFSTVGVSSAMSVGGVTFEVLSMAADMWMIKNELLILLFDWPRAQSATIHQERIHGEQQMEVVVVASKWRWLMCQSFG
jgi:hypothetical protein